MKTEHFAQLLFFCVLLGGLITVLQFGKLSDRVDRLEARAVQIDSLRHTCDSLRSLITGCITEDSTLYTLAEKQGVYQAEVDSAQDYYLQKLNIRTAPLIGYKE